MAVVERLKLCYSQIDGIAAAYGLAPSLPKVLAEFPMCFITLGATTEPVVTNPNTLTVTRRYTARVLGRSVEQPGLDDGTDGVEALLELVPMLTTVHAYFLTRGRLEVDANAETGQVRLGALDNLLKMTLQDSGVVTRPAPGGATHHAIDFYHTITMRRGSYRPR
jgi:hypothetical protein